MPRKDDAIDRMLRDAEAGRGPKTLREQHQSLPGAYRTPTGRIVTPMTHLFEMKDRTDHEKAKSHMPRGSTLSPKGDIGAQRVRELHSALPRPIKRSGDGDPNPLHYRKPDSDNDHSDRSGGHA